MFSEFSNDEAFFVIAAAAVAAVGCIKWYLPIFFASGSLSNRRLLGICPMVALLGLLIVLQNWADPASVAGHWNYIILFLIGGGAWLAGTHWLTTMLGISARDDAIVRHNKAAAVVVCSALLGSMIIYSWRNVGAGPTIWTTILPAAVATAVWIVLWIIIETSTHISDAIAIDRDGASALRMSGWLIGSAFILGRAMAGDWIGWRETWDDFLLMGWPVAPLAIAMIALQFCLRPTPHTPHPAPMARGALPGIVLIGLALICVAAQGAPPIGETIISYEQLHAAGAR